MKFQRYELMEAYNGHYSHENHVHEILITNNFTMNDAIYIFFNFIQEQQIEVNSIIV